MGKLSVGTTKGRGGLRNLATIAGEVNQILFSIRAASGPNIFRFPAAGHLTALTGDFCTLFMKTSPESSFRYVDHEIISYIFRTKILVVLFVLNRFLSICIPENFGVSYCDYRSRYIIIIF